MTSPGRLFSSRGSESYDRRYKGGVIFVDHASGHIQAVPVVNFTAGEAIRAKREYEAEMATLGITVINYHTDNGVFTAAEYQDELAKLGQGMTLSGVGAHHQNAVAERAIGTIVSMTRTMMIHAKLRWPGTIKPDLWPMAMKHAQYILNHTPRMNNVCPLDIVLKTSVTRSALKNLHVWGCPVYVLDPKLQDGQKIPKWNFRSRKAVNLGLSPKHASSVPLVLNLTTGHVSPQFHVIFDDSFSTVSSSDTELTSEDEQSEWEKLLVSNRHQSFFDEDDPVEIHEEWLTELERLERHQKATARVQSGMNKQPTYEPRDEVFAPEGEGNFKLQENRQERAPSKVSFSPQASEGAVTYP